MIAGSVTVTHHDRNGTWLVGLGGEHDISTAPLLDRETGGIWANCTLVVVDLSDTTFIDCSLVHWLLERRVALAGVGDRPLRVVRGPAGGVAERVFDLLQLDDELSRYPSRREALRTPHTASSTAPAGVRW